MGKQQVAELWRRKIFYEWEAGRKICSQSGGRLSARAVRYKIRTPTCSISVVIGISVILYAVGIAVGYVKLRDGHFSLGTIAESSFSNPQTEV